MSLLKYPFSFKQLKNYYRTSTHAPVKGATKPLTRYIVFKPISIHAPAKGATVENMHFMHKHTLIMYISILI